MAEAERDASHNTCNNVTEPANAVADYETKIPEMSGWLMKRSKISHKWKKQWFHLKGTDMFYGDTNENLHKKISLESAEISESNIDNKNNAFRLKPKDAKRVYYLHAEDESIQNNWMQAICFAKATGNSGDASQACVLQ